jgi:endonuclease/exonuclease/phosphatase family metal-dependent hydrolase
MRHLFTTPLMALLLLGCSDERLDPAPLPDVPGTVVVSFNTGSTDGLAHDLPPDDGYDAAQAVITDMWYGNGLAWNTVVEDTRRFFEQVDADIVVFQEIFHSGDCPTVPEADRAGYVCESWKRGMPTVAQVVVGEGWQVACNLGKPDKCAAVNRRLGTFRGCDADLCLDGLDGSEIMGCGSGGRIGRGVIDLESGGTLTLVNVHGSSGIEQEDQDCRVQQFAQVFEDLGDGEPAANGERNLIMGDLNTDPSLTFDFDESAQKWNEHVGEGKRFQFISDIGNGAPASYAGLFNIDHVVSDTLSGSCWIAGLTEDHPAVSDIIFFDHKPVVCRIDVL